MIKDNIFNCCFLHTLFISVYFYFYFLVTFKNLIDFIIWNKCCTSESIPAQAWIMYCLREREKPVSHSIVFSSFCSCNVDMLVIIMWSVCGVRMKSQSGRAEKRSWLQLGWIWERSPVSTQRVEAEGGWMGLTRPAGSSVSCLTRPFDLAGGRFHPTDTASLTYELLCVCVCVCVCVLISRWEVVCVCMPHWRHTKLTITAQAVQTEHSWTVWLTLSRLTNQTLWWRPLITAQVMNSL